MTARPKGISVVVCCYNSAPRISTTLQHILNQQTRAQLQWEIIVVNNNSSDNTATLANDILASAHQQIPFSVVDEPEPGLSFARKKGYDVSKYEYLLLVDDDNWLVSSYIQNVFDLFQELPDVGIIGGWGEPEFENAPPEWFNEFASCYALGEQAEVKPGETWAYGEQVYGAGLAMRMSGYYMLKNAGYSSILSDRKGGVLISGGDTELCMAMNLGPYRTIYDNRLKFKHLMPAGRITWPYLKRLTVGFGRSTVKTHIYQHYISGGEVPSKNLRFPLWLDRYLNLLKGYKVFCKQILFGSWFSNVGDASYLNYLGWKGRLFELRSLKEEYASDHYKVAALAAALKTQKIIK